VPSSEDTDQMLSRYMAQSDRVAQALESCNSALCGMDERLKSVEGHYTDLGVRISELTTQMHGNLQALMEHKLEKAQADTTTAVSLAKLAAVCEDHARRFDTIEKKATEQRSAWGGLFPSIVSALVVSAVTGVVVMFVVGGKQVVNQSTQAPSAPVKTTP
jgi:chromosome segregation ATPase